MGPNVKRLVIRRMTKQAISLNGGLEEAIGFLSGMLTQGELPPMKAAVARQIVAKWEAGVDLLRQGCRTCCSGRRTVRR